MKTSKLIVSGFIIVIVVITIFIVSGLYLIFRDPIFVEYPVPIQNSETFYDVTGVKIPEIQVKDSSYFSTPAFDACNATYRYKTPVDYKDIEKQIRYLMKHPKDSGRNWEENLDNFTFPYGDGDITISKHHPYELKIHFVRDTGSDY